MTVSLLRIKYVDAARGVDITGLHFRDVHLVRQDLRDAGVGIWNQTSQEDNICMKKHRDRVFVEHIHQLTKEYVSVDGCGVGVDLPLYLKTMGTIK